MKAILLIVSWIHNAPYVQLQPVESMAICQTVAAATSRMISAQAFSNMTSPHRNLTLEKDDETGELRLLSGTVGREVVRLSCLASPASKN